MSELPESWEIASLGNICGTGQYGWTTKSESQGSVKYLRTTDITKKRIDWDSVPYCQKNPPDIHQYQIQINDILISRSGSIGFSALIRDIPYPTVFASYIIRFIPFKNIEPRYVAYFLRSPEYWRQISNASTGIAVANVNARKLAEIRVPIAPLNEQKRIADKLDALFARIDACSDRLKRVPLLLKRFRQAVLAAATSGELTDIWRKEKERSWSVVNVQEVAEAAFDGPFGSHLKSKDYTNSGVRVIRLENIGHLRFIKKATYISTEKYESLKKHTLQPNDVLFSSFIEEEIRVCLFPQSEGLSINKADCFCIRVNTDKCLAEFLSFRLACYSTYKVMRDLVHGATRPRINLKQLKQFEFELPPIDEQHEIVRRVQALFGCADRLETDYQNASAKVERLMPALLDKTFRGELLPQDQNDEPSSVLLERIGTEKALMETERETTHIIRRSTKQSPKNTMKQASDYVEAIRSAFAKADHKIDARQLFDQAGFSPEEVVQFYEALRATPEVRIAFENIVEERPQQNRSIFDSTDKSSMISGHFRLVELWLEDFKNLSDYTVRFYPSHSIDIVLGWNGTGKSNLFEALVIIFRDLHEWVERNRWSEKLMKGYRLRYQINQQIVEVSWLPGEMKRPKLKMGILQEGMEEPDKLESISRGKLPLPRFVFGYYSGPTNRLAEHFLPMKQAHYTRLREAKSDDPETLTRLLEQRRFFCAENHHAKYVLLAFCHKEDADISRFLEEKLRIIGFESALFIIRKPDWARKGQTADDFWGATGIMRRVMERLRQFAIAPMVVEQTVSDGYRSRREDHYYFFLPDLQSLHAFAAEYQNARTFFLALESTDFSELIYDLKLQVRVKATNTEQIAITFHELSEGEQQLLMVLGLMRFTKSHQSLVLLDEPDTHLNPHWNVDYLKLLTRVMSEGSGESEEQQTSQILMSTHDPLVIASLVKEQIHLLKRDWQTGVCKWEQPTVNPRGLGFTGILTSEMFGMRSDLDEETLADLDNKVRLVAKEDLLTPEEFSELEKINKRLEDAGFQKAFSDPYYAAFVRAWGRRYSDLMAGVRFLNPAQQEEIDRIAREVLEETLAELQAEEID